MSKYPAVARGEGRWALLELTDALEFSNEDLENIGRRVSRSWSISDFFKFRLCWSVFDFDFSDALFNFLLAQSVLLTSDQ